MIIAKVPLRITLAGGVVIYQTLLINMALTLSPWLLIDMYI